MANITGNLANKRFRRKDTGDIYQFGFFKNKSNGWYAMNETKLRKGFIKEGFITEENFEEILNDKSKV